MFAAFLNTGITNDLLTQERLSYGSKKVRADEDLQIVLNLVRERRFAIQRGEVETEFAAIAAPIMDWEGNPIVVIGATVSKYIDEDRISSIADILTKFARHVSAGKPSFSFES